MPTPRLPALLAVAAATLGGCTGEPPQQPGVQADAQREACVRLLRELRLYCHEGIREPRAALGIDCVSRRLEFERQCN